MTANGLRLTANGLVLAVALATPALAQRAVIDFERAKVQPFPIAVAAPAGGGEAAQIIAQVISADFDRSGLFKLLDPKSFLADAAKEGLDAKAIDFKPWIAVGAQGLLKLKVSPGAGGIQAEAHLYDPARAAEVWTGKQGGPAGGMR